MPPPTNGDAARCTADVVNSRIRRLMSRPSSAARTAEYVRLLALWADATAARRKTPV